VYLVLVVFHFFSLACLVRVRALASKRKELKQLRPLEVGFTDDSGSKLRDKEQQRLSSK